MGELEFWSIILFLIFGPGIAMLLTPISIYLNFIVIGAWSLLIFGFIFPGIFGAWG